MRKLRRVFSEPSTWAGLAAPVGVLATQLPAPYSYGCYAASAIFAMFAVIFREKGNA